MKTEHNARSSFRKTPLMAGLVLACGLFAGNTSAQWVVTDPGHTAGTIAEAMCLLARTEGIWAETAGGVTVAVARKLIEQGRIPRDEEIVLCITGNGLKTQEAVNGLLEKPVVIEPALEAVERVVESTRETALV